MLLVAASVGFASACVRAREHYVEAVQSGAGHFECVLLL